MVNFFYIKVGDRVEFVIKNSVILEFRFHVLFTFPSMSFLKRKTLVSYSVAWGASPHFHPAALQYTTIKTLRTIV